MYGIDSGNGYVYGKDPAVEEMEKKQEQEQEQEEKSNGRDEFLNYG